MAVLKQYRPHSFDAIEQSHYIDAMLAVYEINNIKPLVDLYIYSYRHTAEKYNVTMEAIGFDRVRVQYRQQRKEMIRHIIIKKLHGSEMDQYIKSRSEKFVDPNDQMQFIRNIHEDLEQLSPQNIIGMGITMKQVQNWKK